MADLTIHIRGVGVYVANTRPGEVTEILFPQAERNPPDGDDAGTPSDGKPRKMKHADGTRANEHFAGMLIMRGRRGEPVELSGCCVQLSENSGGHSGVGAVIKDNFLEMVPPLDEIIVDRTRGLRLLAESERRNPERVALRLIMDAGSLRKAVNSEQKWIFDRPPGWRDEQEYYIEGEWRIPRPSSGRLVLEVSDFVSGDVTTIELDTDVTEVFIFNFDKKKPTKAELRRKHKAKKPKTDDDFKWVYQLFEKDFSTWQEWMTSDELPAPRLSREREAPRTVSVSTCFEVVWTGDDD